MWSSDAHAWCRGWKANDGLEKPYPFHNRSVMVELVVTGPILVYYWRQARHVFYCTLTELSEIGSIVCMSMRLSFLSTCSALHGVCKPFMLYNDEKADLTGNVQLCNMYVALYVYTCVTLSFCLLSVLRCFDFCENDVILLNLSSHFVCAPVICVPVVLPYMVLLFPFFLLSACPMVDGETLLCLSLRAKVEYDGVEFTQI